MTDVSPAEAERLAALSRYRVMDTPREPAFDEIAALAAAICRTPIAVINLIGEGRQFFKAEVGLGVRETPLETSFCAKALLEDEFLLVPDATRDSRFDGNPLVTGAPHLRFYAGALLKTEDGQAIGTVCVLDHQVRDLDETQQQALRVLARQVMAQLELRRTLEARDVEIERTRRREAELRLVLDSARDYAILTVDPERRVTSWSAGAEATFGVSADEAVGRSADRFFTPEDVATGVPEAEIGQAHATGFAPDVRWHRRADGTRIFLNGSVHRLPADEHGRPRGFLKIARNESLQREETEELARTRVALGESEDRFRNMADHAPVMMWVTDPAGACLYLNRRWYEFTGQTEAEALGLGWLDATHPDDKAEAERVFLEANAGQKPFRLEYRLRRADGAYRWAIDAASPRFGENGAFLGYVGSVIDIEDRRESERRLRESEEQLRLATEAADIGLWDVDVVADTLFWPPRVKAMFGISPDVPVTMQDYYDGLHPDDFAHTAAAYASAADPERRAVYDVEYRTVGKEDGAVRWVAAKGRGVFDADGVCRRVIGTAMDITRRKAVEQALHELNETLEQRVMEALEERAKAEEALRQAQKMEAVGQLTGGIAHDFNNLLTGVIGSLDLMQRRIAQGQTDRIDRYATAAITSANRAAALTHRLLAFSRRQPLDPRPVNANRLVTGMEELLRRTLGEAVRLEIVTAGGLWLTLCDPHQLESAILNLAINARDAMPTGGVLTIETCNAHLDSAYAARAREVRPGQYVCICVTDTGVGMTPEVIAKAFEPFFTTKPIGQGTGLGLSMIYGFARQSDGYAKIYSEVGEGTTFKLYLPRHFGEGEAEAEVELAAPPAARVEHGEVVLVVEDETAVRDLVVDLLGELGYRAIEAADGPSGLKLLESDLRIDLLITDVGLPGLNGRQLADHARARRPELKVLFMTGYAENAAAANGFLEPGMQMVTKPFAIDALAGRIREIIHGG